MWDTLLLRDTGFQPARFRWESAAGQTAKRKGDSTNTSSRLREAAGRFCEIATLATCSHSTAGDHAQLHYAHPASSLNADAHEAVSAEVVSRALRRADDATPDGDRCELAIESNLVATAERIEEIQRRVVARDWRTALTRTDAKQRL